MSHVELIVFFYIHKKMPKYTTNDVGHKLGNYTSKILNSSVTDRQNSFRIIINILRLNRCPDFNENLTWRNFDFRGNYIKFPFTVITDIYVGVRWKLEGLYEQT